MTAAVSDKAVVLAAGLGSRMRREQAGGRLSDQQASVAATGVKALMPFGRPFLDYVLHNLAEAGWRRICLVIGPDHDVLRDRYGQLEYSRISISFAVQPQPKGTADAVLAAEQFVGDDPLLVVNSDNLYPVDALRSLREAGGPAAIGFDLKTVLAADQWSVERVAAMAVMQCDQDGCLKQIIEKPPAEILSSGDRPLYVSMNCWRFSPAIFEACRRIGPSSRGEYELPAAVAYAVQELGERFQVIPSHEPVLDLSHRSDVPQVAEQLHDREVRL